VSESRSGEHQKLLERLQTEVSERFGASGAPTAERAISNARAATERAPYVVGITNATDGALSVRLAYVTSNSPDDVQELSDEISPGAATGFVLTRPRQCASLVGYVMLLTPEGQRPFRSPEEGAWTPERVSQETGDTVPCSDSWQLG
jgi:hypothetical protein